MFLAIIGLPRSLARCLSLWAVVFPLAFLSPTSRAAASAAPGPQLLTEAVKKWEASGQDLAFTQRMVAYGKDKTVKETRLARYDPSLPDRERWRLLEVDGQPATEKQRKDWEGPKNRRPRNRNAQAPSSYLDLPNARLVEDAPDFARYEAGLLKDKISFASTEQLALLLQVDKKSGTLTHVSALLREPMKIALGLARITDLDLDLFIEPNQAGEPPGTVNPDASARLAFTKFGAPMELSWTDFARVTPHPDAEAAMAPPSAPKARR